MARRTASVASLYLFCGVLLRILKRWSLYCIVILFYFTTKGFILMEFKLGLRLYLAATIRQKCMFLYIISLIRQIYYIERGVCGSDRSQYQYKSVLCIARLVGGTNIAPCEADQCHTVTQSLIQGQQRDFVSVNISQK